MHNHFSFKSESVTLIITCDLFDNQTLVIFSIQVLDKLKKQNYDCYVLSNWSAETFIGMTDDYPFLQSFDGILISGEDKMMKPNAEIYELAISRFNLIPQETIFIDDK